MYCAAQGFDQYFALVMYSAGAANKNLPLTMFMTLLYLLLAVITALSIFKMLTVRIEKEQSEAERNAAASQAKSAFLANMSHEIRTPINAVLGMDEMILRESKDETILGYAQNIKNAGTMLLSIINEFLTFPKSRRAKWNCSPKITMSPRSRWIWST